MDNLGRAWLADERLSPDNARIFISLLKELRATYEKHIAVEDNELFSLAEKILDQAELETIAEEMATRRGLVVGKPIAMGTNGSLPTQSLAETECCSQGGYADASPVQMLRAPDRASDN